MKLGEYKNYRICSCCGEILPLTRQNFKRLVTQGKEAFHMKCKRCEEREKYEREWKDGKLLCHCCGEYKDISEYSPNGGSNYIRNNRRSICRTCSTLRQKQNNKNLPDEQKLMKCLRWRWLGARDRSKRQNIDFSISIDDIKDLWIKQNGICALSGINMTYELQNGRTPTNVSIDKIDRAKGYILGNIQLVCMACNQIKSDLSEDTMYKFCKSIVDHYENK